MSEKGYKKVSELVYVLFVESIIFASVSITLIGQRMNVFDWPETRTWPVLGTTIQILLTYTLFVLLLVCFIHINRFDDYVIEGSQACVKSVGRLITVTAMFTLTTCTLVSQESITQQPGRALPQYLTCLKALFTGFHMLYHLCPLSWRLLRKVVVK